MTEAGPKKGKPSWKPAPGLLDLPPPPGFRRRFVDKSDPLNIARKQAQGWTFEKAETLQVPGMSNAQGATEYRELVAMVLPEEIAEARAEYYDKITEERSITPATRAKKERPEFADFVYDVDVK